MNFEQDEKWQTEAASETPATDPEVLRYRQLFQALAKTPPMGLPHDFAFRVTQQLIERQARQARLREMGWIGFTLLLLVGATGFIFYAYPTTLDTGAFTFLEKYRGLLIFAIVLIGGLQWLDRWRLVRKKM